MDGIYLATYGTLREGHSNWVWILDCQPAIGTFKVQGYHMYTNGSFPYAIPTRSKDTIVVDLFLIDKPTFLNCDRLEGYPHHYDRREVQLIGSDITPWMYFKPRVEAGHILGKMTRIKSGDWLHRPEKSIEW